MGRHTRRSLLLPILSALLSLSAATNTIPPGDYVGDGNFLVSADGHFKLGFFTPAGSKFRYLGIWFNAISVQTVVWVANRVRPLPDSTGVLSLYANGSLVLSDARGDVYWSTAAVTGLDSPVAMLLNNGNFVMMNRSKRGDSPEDDYPWQSFDYPTDSLLPDMKLGWDLRSGRNRSLTAWRSADDPAPGEYGVVMDTRGDPQIVLVRGTTRLWRTGPWIGQRFSGIQAMTTYKALFRPELVTSAHAVYYRFHSLNSSVRSRLVVLPTGVVERVAWNEDDGTWKRFWLAPKDQCESVMMSPCGPFGVCDTNDSPVCSCLRGFDPKSRQDWYLGDGKDGCLRRTALDCRNGTDGFVLVAGAKLPDTSAAVVNRTLGLEGCRVACLGNCSCTAYSSAELTESGGSGCILWGVDLMDLTVYGNGGHDLFVRVAAADVDKPSSRARQGRRWVSVLTVACAVLGTLLLGWVAYCVWRRRTRKRTVLLSDTTSKSNHKDVNSSRDNDDLDLPLFDFRTIAAATDDFSNQNKLGEGGFGPVYKGRLEGGQEVAVKRLARNSVQGLDEFKNEVLLIAKLQHRNLVRLLGCCIQGEEQMLIYEYMPNKSLDAFLFDTRKGPLLDWGRRYHIIQGIARGLLYLHQDSRLRIVHRDLKPSNVLLDGEMNPKISDFGMARMFCGDETEANTSRVVGTHGYMSPEYITHGVFSAKSDVFSFGVMVLEIVSGKKNRGILFSDPNLSLLGYAWGLWKEGDWLELVDSSVGNSFPIAEVRKCVNVGLLCVQERPEDRPTMASVVQLLGNETASLPQPKQPAFVAMRSAFDVWSSSNKEKLSSVNEVTITTFDGR